MIGLRRRQVRDLDHRADLDGPALRHWDALRNRDGLVQILGLDQEVTAQLLVSLGERAVGDEALSLTNPDAGCGGSRMKRRRGQITPGGVNLMGEGGRVPIAL